MRLDLLPIYTSQPEQRVPSRWTCHLLTAAIVVAGVAYIWATSRWHGFTY
jgi:hypothetical protein